MGARCVGRLVLCVATLLAGGLHAGAHADADAPSPSPSRHITQADMLQQASGSFGAPEAVVDARGPAGDWRRVSLPHVSVPRPMAPAADEDGRAIVTTWYRFETGTFAGIAPSQLHLYLPRWQTIGQVAVYGDGRLLFHSRGSPVWNGFNHPLWVPVAPTAGAQVPGVVLIRLSSARVSGGAISSAWVGPADDLMWRYRLRSWLQVELPHMSSAAFLVIGLFSLAVWAVRRRETIYGLFFASSVLFYVRCLHFHWGVEPVPVPEDWFGWATVNSLGWLLVTIYFFGFRLHGRTYPALERSFLLLMLFSTVIMLPPLKAVPLAALVAPLAYLAMLAGGVLVVGTALWSAWRARSRDALILAGFNLAMLPMAVHDLLLQSYLVSVESFYLTPYGGIGNFVIFLVIVTRRYIGALADVEQSNTRLEQRLRQREIELTESHQQLRAIEHERTLSGERRRLMQDMHDGLGSSLMSALRMVQGGRMTEAEVSQVLIECIDDLKLTIDSLEPVEPDLLLLLATLRFRLEPRLENTGLHMVWDVNEVPPLNWLNPRSALNILRMLQETFTNVIKHAQASEIRVSTSSDDSSVFVCVDDNGKGMPEDAQRFQGKGLLNLRRRAQAIGADIEWDSSGRGTRVRIRLPLVSGAGEDGRDPMQESNSPNSVSPHA